MRTKATKLDPKAAILVVPAFVLGIVLSFIIRLLIAIQVEWEKCGDFFDKVVHNLKSSKSIHMRKVHK